MSQENIDLFDAHRSQTLSEEAQKSFEQRLEEDSEFRKAYDEYLRDLKLAMAISAGEEMKTLMNAEATGAAPGKKIPWKYLIPLGIAAALVFFIFIISPDKRLDHGALFEQYFEPFPDITTARGDKTNQVEALRAYGQGDFKEAIRLLDKPAVSNDTTLFYKAVSHLGLKQAPDAIENMNLMNKGNELYDFTHWFKGLSYLLLEESDSAKVYFSKVPDASIYKQSAELILEELQ